MPENSEALRIVQVVPAISEEASGPSYSVVRLCMALRDMGATVSLAVLDWNSSDAMLSFEKRFPLGLGPRRLGRSPAMYEWLRSEIELDRIDIAHNHSMWQLNSLYPAWADQGRKVQLVASPRGALSPWAMRNGSSAKKVFWPLLQRPALDRVTCFHATSEEEVSDIRGLGFRQPVTVIPNGIHIPPVRTKAVGEQREVLFLGRIHPKKGIELLLRAWQIVMDECPDWRLSVVGRAGGYGGDESYLSKMQAMSVGLGLRRVVFKPPVYGDEKWKTYQAAAVFVLPTHSENFGMTVAESLACGTPVVVSKGAPWESLAARKCGWWIDNDLECLVEGLRTAMRLSDAERSEMGRNGREWMIREFSWEDIGRRMLTTYQWLKFGGGTPSWVRMY